MREASQLDFGHQRENVTKRGPKRREECSPKSPCFPHLGLFFTTNFTHLKWKHRKVFSSCKYCNKRNAPSEERTGMEETILEMFQECST